METVEYHGCSKSVREMPMPLFEEHARKKHPVTSHLRAERLSKTPKLTAMVLAVLKVVADCPSRTARDLGLIMYSKSNVLEQSTWPHKNMKKLVDAGWVYRRHNETGLLCFVTELGNNILKGKEYGHQTKQITD